MSYEYVLKFSDPRQVQSAFEKIRNGQWVVEGNSDRIVLKGPMPHSWHYDARVFRESGDSLLLEIAMPDPDIYRAISDSLQGFDFIGYESGFEDEELSLSDILKLPQG